ncbi:MAG: Toluene tolerance protein Ttg2D [uncultured bacterium]|nr:MAG: Toluene tolerance protein Ttg2D [uncultured bacterium]
MKLVKILVVIFGVLFGASSFAVAADPAPLAMIKSTSSQMLRELDRHIGNLKNNDKLVYDLVNRVLVPHFDLISMSRAVIGPNYWQQASSNTQQQFIKEFTRYVIRTYSSALQSYDGETIKFYPIRGGISSKVQIDSDLLLKNGPPIQMQYRLLQQGSQWLIYDFSVDGVSIIKNYNSQFAGTLRQGGLDAVVKQLQKNNARNLK